MATKLTLRLDENIIEKAKNYAKGCGKSVSQIVSEYFAALEKGDSGFNGADVGPITKKLLGIMGKRKIDEAEYKRHLEEKYL